MQIWMDGVSILKGQPWTVFSIMIVMIWGQTVFIAYFRKKFNSQLSGIAYLCLGSLGWILPVALSTVLIFAAAIVFGRAGEAVILLACILLYAHALFMLRDLIPSGLAFLGIFTFFVIIRLAFIHNAVLPLYFDSAEHYRIIKYFAGSFDSQAGSFPLVNYYHVGFHFISAAITHVFSLGIVDTMLVFGQVLLAILPFSLFLMINQETGSPAAAIFACLVAGFGWHMPAHLMNWGKYPALLSLVCILFTLNIGYLYYRQIKFGIRSALLVWLLVMGCIASLWVHSRTLVVYGFVLLSILWTYWRGRLPIKFQRLAFIILICILSVEIFFIKGSPALAPLFGGYLENDLSMLFATLILTCFSMLFFPGQTFLLLASFSTLILGLFIPINLPGLGALTVLDRPYVQMLLYIPLSLMGGLGFSGLSRFLQRFSFSPKLLPGLVNFSLFGFVAWNAVVHQKYYPSTCCQIVTRDDLAALHWIDKSLPASANIIISSTELYVTSLETQGALAGSDGGVWVRPLTSRLVMAINSDTDFGAFLFHKEICKTNIVFVYVGGAPQSFNLKQLDLFPGWYRIVFQLPQARVYQVVGCQKGRIR